MFSIYAKVITPESSPVLGPMQSPTTTTTTTQPIEPLDSVSPQQQQQQQLLDNMGGIGLLCACCSRARGGNSSSSSSSSAYIPSYDHDNDIEPTLDVLENCKHETHFTHYNYRAITPRQMPPF